MRMSKRVRSWNRARVLLLLLLLLPVLGCGDAHEKIVQEHQLNLLRFTQTGNEVCPTYGLKLLYVTSEDLETYNVVCYHDSPFRTRVMEYER